MPTRLRPEKAEAQGGAKKPRGFWKEQTTREILRRYYDGEMSLNDAAAALATDVGAVKHYSAKFFGPKAASSVG